MKGLLEYTLKYKGFPIKAAKGKLSKVLKTTDVEFDKWYLQQRDKIVQFHATHNKFYRSKIKSLDATNEFEKLPIITKKDFQDGLENIVSDGFKLKNLYKGSTSGSSGHPFYFVKDKVCLF